MRSEKERSDERRLHPTSILFGFGSQLRTLALPGIAVLVAGGAAGFAWQLWLMLMLVPYSLISLFHYLTFRYRYEASEMVIRSGLLFRKVRHVPYGRVQNLDAVQNVFHRLFGVIEVRLETGSGKEPEAILRVVPVDAFEEMQRRVIADRAGATSTASRDPDAGVDVAPVAGAEPAPAGETLLELSPRELLLCGLIENRGWVLVAAILGVAWELDVMDTAGEWVFDNNNSSGRDAVRGVTQLFDLGAMVERIGLTIAAIAALLVLLRLLSMAWALVRLYGFRLSREGGDLRAAHGLLTRVATTVPRRRIQTLTIRESPLHRLFERASVKVETAGGEGEGENKTRRESLAPIIRRERLKGLLRHVLPGLDLDLDAVGWQKIHPRAFRRVVKWWIFLALVLSIPVFVLFRFWGFAVLPLFLGWGVLIAKKYVEHLRWAVTGEAALLKSGWIWRKTSIVPCAKIQAVAIRESPWDRRAAMASLKVDVAGAGELSHRVDVPYLARDVADRLADRLAARAARTAFQW